MRCITPVRRTVGRKPKLSDDDVKYIINEMKGGKSNAALCMELEVTKPTLLKAVKGFKARNPNVKIPVVPKAPVAIKKEKKSGQVSAYHVVETKYKIENIQHEKAKIKLEKLKELILTSRDKKMIEAMVLILTNTEDTA